MNIFKKAKNHIDAYIAHKGGLALNEFIDIKEKTLKSRAPDGESPFYLSIQPDGSTVRTETVKEEKDISDEQALRKKQGNIYSNLKQRLVTQIIESISQAEMEIRDAATSLNEIRKAHDEILKTTPNHHLLKQDALRSFLVCLLIGLGDAVSLFYLFCDFWGVDLARMFFYSTSALFTLFFTFAFVVASVLIAHQALSKKSFLWFACLAVLAVIIGKMRTVQGAVIEGNAMDNSFWQALYTAISFILPISAAFFFKRWNEISEKTGKVESEIRRLNEQEQACLERLNEANSERQRSLNELDKITKEYVKHYERALSKKERLETAWERHARYVEGYLADLKFAFLFWKGWQSIKTSVSKPVKALIKIATLLSIFILFAYPAYADDRFNILVVCDRSSSAQEFSCSSESLEDAGRFWTERADQAGGGSFEVFLVDRGFDTTSVLFSESYPPRFPGPVTVNKKKWKNKFLQNLSEKTPSLPVNKGSAIVEAVHRASLRIPDEGETLIYVLSDMREVNKSFNFERQVPSEREFLNWLDRKAIKPKFKDSTKLVACGVHPYTPDNTGKMTTQNYEQLLRLWQAAFDKWGVRASISEVCQINNQWR